MQVSVSERCSALGGSSEPCRGFPAPEHESRLCAVPADEDVEEHRGYQDLSGWIWLCHVSGSDV